MDARIKELWTTKLRSKEYKQGRGRLVTTTKPLHIWSEIPEHVPEDAFKDATYCCYGVLCDLYRLETGDLTIRSIMAVNAYLPPVVRDWAKLSTGNPVVPDPSGADGFCSLAGLNDNGKDFNYIADKIEENL